MKKLAPYEVVFGELCFFDFHCECTCYETYFFAAYQEKNVLIHDRQKQQKPLNMWVSKNSGVSPQIIHFNRVFHYFHHPFWGTSIFGNIHVVKFASDSVHKQLGDYPGYLKIRLRNSCSLATSTWHPKTRFWHPKNHKKSLPETPKCQMPSVKF